MNTPSLGRTIATASVLLASAACSAEPDYIPQDRVRIQTPPINGCQFELESGNTTIGTSRELVEYCEAVQKVDSLKSTVAALVSCITSKPLENTQSGQLLVACGNPLKIANAVTVLEDKNFASICVTGHPKTMCSK